MGKHPANRFRRQRGVALIVTMLVLMLLSAIVIAMVYNSDSETNINANFRSYQKAYFAAVAGIEEARMRMAATQSSAITPPTAMPTISNGGVFYIRNPSTVGGSAETVDPSNPSNPYFDSELCHEGFTGLGLSDPGTYVACTTAPTGTHWYTYLNSISPFTNGNAALPYKWVRITLKANASPAPFYVDGGRTPAPTAARCAGPDSRRSFCRPGTRAATCRRAAHPRIHPSTALLRMPRGRTGWCRKK